MYPKVDLSTAVVVITGGARGIGQATAHAFANLGATVYAGDLPEPSPPPALPEPSTLPKPSARPDHPGQPAFPNQPGATTIRARPLDVTSRDSFATFIDGVIAETGRIDVLVNNAGVMPLGRFLDEPDAISRATLEVNIWGLIHGMRLVLPGMLAQGKGHVVNLASMAGKIPFPGMAVYNASKYAAVGLSAAVRRELHGTGVSVSAVLPSAVRTSLSSGVRLGGIMPTVDPSDVAAAVIRTCRTRRAETPVPGFLAGWDLLDGLIPEPLMALGRRLSGDDRALAVDHAARAQYEARLTAFTGPE